MHVLAIILITLFIAFVCFAFVYGVIMPLFGFNIWDYLLDDSREPFDWEAPIYRPKDDETPK